MARRDWQRVLEARSAAGSGGGAQGASGAARAARVPKLRQPEAAGQSTLGAEFELILRGAELKGWTTELQFCPWRKWRFDYAWPELKVAVELDGLTARSMGRHQSVMGFTRDCEKLNAAVLLGWKVLRFTQVSLRDPDTVQKLVSLALDGGAYGSDS